MKTLLSSAEPKAPVFKAGDIVCQKDLIGVVYKEDGCLMVAWTNGVTTRNSPDLNTHFYGTITVIKD